MASSFGCHGWWFHDCDIVSLSGPWAGDGDPAVRLVGLEKGTAFVITDPDFVTGDPIRAAVASVQYLNLVYV